MKASSCFLLILSVFTIWSCAGDGRVQTGSDVNIDSITLPENFSYQGRKPEMGRSSDLELVIDWNRRRSDLDPTVGDLVADTLTMRLADGKELIIPRDSVVQYLTDIYSSMNSQNVTINAAIPIYYTDIDHHWVYSWIFLEVDSKNGGKQIDYYHEDYQIIAGKIALLYQFKRIPPDQVE